MLHKNSYSKLIKNNLIIINKWGVIMTKYVVISYEKTTGLASSKGFDTKKEAFNFIIENYFIDKKHNEENNWIYKIIKVEF